MKIEGSVALVSGGNRGLGKAFVQALLDGGAQKVYVGARRPIETADPRLQPVMLDITDAQSVAAAAEACQDVTILINNAGVAFASPLLTASGARTEIETNYLGTLAMCQAFAPILKKNGGGALVNMLSVVSWYSQPFLGSYSASKAAAWSLTNGVRMELRAQGTLVVGVHAGLIDTDMAAQFDGTKTRPQDVAAATMEAIIAGREEVLADKVSQETRTALVTDQQSFYRQMQQLWDNRNLVSGVIESNSYLLDPLVQASTSEQVCPA